MPEEMKQEESKTWKVLKAISSTDWKSLVILLSALTGALGFAWNKIELYVQDYQQQQVAQKAVETEETTEGAYEVVATRLDEIYGRLEALEKRTRTKKVEYVPKPKPQPLEPVASARAKLKAKTKQKPQEGEPDKVATMIGKILDEESAPKPVSERFEKARMPEYQQIQRQAVEGELIDFIDEVKKK